MSKDEELKEKLTVFLDQDPRKWVRSAFYSDPEVQQVMDDLYGKWEESGRKGMPIDHASHDELVFLWNKASKYLGMNENVARAIVFNRLAGHDEHVKKPGGKGIFSRLFGNK
jgi:hypothetical protein